MTGKVTVALVMSHRLRDMGLIGLYDGDEHPAYTPQWSTPTAALPLSGPGAGGAWTAAKAA